MAYIIERNGWYLVADHIAYGFFTVFQDKATQFRDEKLAQTIARDENAIVIPVDIKKS